MSRIRQIKPSFFKDPDMADLSPSVRLFYIGLWTLADDAGYYRWDVAEVGVELFGYESRSKREKNAVAYRDELIAAKRVQTFQDCAHIFLPTFTRHQRFAGPTKRVLMYEREHLSCPSPQTPAVSRVSPRIPEDPRPGIGTGTVVVGNGTERIGKGSAGDFEEEPSSEFRSKVRPEFIDKGST